MSNMEKQADLVMEIFLFDLAMNAMQGKFDKILPVQMWKWFSNFLSNLNKKIFMAISLKCYGKSLELNHG